MMDGEEVYRTRLAEALAAAERETLEHAKRKHLTAAAAWQTLIDLDIERRAEND
ncbi:hypothetical protein [Aureimonas pseudogalii]|uniref:Uncharacterized protein n=1 Tax=Aureimonas pseudogalii TaxID=1744844 RepID=A0A7W6EA84_9HYPH|nr:hypothetical protein [Aureimonas pseudogalii]MBB3997164.1 hypothetical protein [Aureimonas pseudogalii]